jgi:hypothetical protein
MPGSFSIRRARFLNAIGAAQPARDDIEMVGVNVSDDPVTKKTRLTITAISTIGLLVSDLATTPGNEDGEVRNCIGRDKPDDGGGGPFYWVEDGNLLYEDNGWGVVAATGGVWRRQAADGNAVNICWFGCKWNGTVDCGVLINAFLTQWKADHGIASSVTLFVPDIQFSRHRGNTTNGSPTVTGVSPTSGLWIGARICGVGIPANTRITNIVGSTVTMSANATSSPGAKILRVSPYGYKLSTRVEPPDQIFSKIRGESPARINSVGFGTATSTTDRAGPVFVCDIDVDGLSRYPDVATYPFVDVERIGFLGPGSHLTTGIGLDTWYFSEHCAVKDVQCVGFATGLHLRGSVQIHAIERVKCYGNADGCIVGMAGGTAECVEAEVSGLQVLFNERGLTLLNAKSVTFAGLNCQANQDGIIIGESGGTHRVSTCTFDNPYGEQNGTDNAYYVSGKHITMYAATAPGANITNLYFRQMTLTGIGGGTARQISVPGAAVVQFDSCVTGGALSLGANASVALIGGDHKGGFTAITQNTVSRLARPSNSYGSGANATGSLAHDCGNDGDEADYAVTGNVTVQVPSNTKVGDRVRYSFRNTGTFTIETSGTIRTALGAGALDNTGAANGARAELEIHNVGSNWHVSRWTGWMTT